MKNKKVETFINNKYKDLQINYNRMSKERDFHKMECLQNRIRDLEQVYRFLELSGV